MAISADGQRFLTGDEGGTAKLWNAQGKALASYDHQAAISKVAFSPWDQSTVTASRDSTLCFWDEDGKCVLKLTHPDPITDFQLRKNRKLILITGPTVANLYNQSGTLLKTFRPGTEIVSAELSPNGSHLLIATTKEVQLWNTFFLSEQFIGQDIAPQFCTLTDSIKRAHFIQSDARNIRLLVIGSLGATIYDKDCLDESPSYDALATFINRNLPIDWMTFSHPGYQNPKVLWVSNETEVRMWAAYRIDGEGNPKTDLSLFSAYG